RSRHTRFSRDWSSDVCSSDLDLGCGLDKALPLMASRKAQLEALHAQIRVCTLCPLCASRTHAVPGDGRPGARALLVGEGPGEDEIGRASCRGRESSAEGGGTP